MLCVLFRVIHEWVNFFEKEPHMVKIISSIFKVIFFMINIKRTLPQYLICYNNILLGQEQERKKSWVYGYIISVIWQFLVR